MTDDVLRTLVASPPTPIFCARRHPTSARRLSDDGL